MIFHCRSVQRLAFALFLRHILKVRVTVDWPMHRIFHPLTLTLLLLLGTASVWVARPNYAAADDLVTVTPSQADTLRRDGMLMLDVRRSEEWRDTGVVPGSILVTAFDAEGRLNAEFLRSLEKQTDRNRPLLLICRSGNRSAKIGTLLAQAGYTQLYNVAGGMLAWRSEALPVERCVSC